METFLNYYRPVDVPINDIRLVLTSLGVSIRYSGFETTVLAIQRITQDPSRLSRICKCIYQDLGETLGVGKSCIERRIRYVAQIAWGTNPERLEELTGCCFPDGPSVSEFLGGLAFYFLIMRDNTSCTSATLSYNPPAYTCFRSVLR